MKFTIAFAALLAAASAQFIDYDPFSGVPYTTPRPVYRVSTIAPINRVVGDEAAASIIRYDSDSSPDGSYAYAYETNNGISAQEQGTPREFSGNPPVRPVVAQGSYSYTSPEGQPIAISYIADENGFQPTGDSIPTSPPIPEAILRALDYIARNGPVQKKK